MDVCLLTALGVDGLTLGFMRATGERVQAGAPSFPTAAGTFAELVEGAGGFQCPWISVTSRQSFRMWKAGGLRAVFLPKGGSSTPGLVNVAEAERDCRFAFVLLRAWVRRSHSKWIPFPEPPSENRSKLSSFLKIYKLTGAAHLC